MYAENIESLDLGAVMFFSYAKNFYQKLIGTWLFYLLSQSNE